MAGQSNTPFEDHTTSAPDAPETAFTAITKLPEDGFATVVPMPAESTSSAAPPLRRVGEYEILSELGRGGMGVVYKARHTKLQRLAALKLIRAGEFADESLIARFKVEAEAAAQLDHPNIVSVYEVGEHAGEPFLAMAFVDGVSLWQRIQKSPLEPREGAVVIEQVVRAVGHAHGQGIIHRDLKPQNILLTATGQPRVMDFGLAKRRSTDSGLTATGQVMGTPSYMPPEQALGATGEQDERVDVYALGATLYCTLTGRPPFQGATLHETLRQVIEQDPVPPRYLNSSISAELEAICMKCLAKSPRERYQSCDQLAADLQRFLQGDPVSASLLNWSGKLLRLVQRNRDDVHLKHASSLLGWFALIVFAAELGMTLTDHTRGIGPALVIRSLQFAGFGAVAWWFRKHSRAMVNAAAAQIWTLSCGFIAACFVVVFSHIAYHHATTPDAPQDYFVNYPAFYVVSGLFFIALGRQYWGACYLIGVLFYLSALIVPFWMQVSPLVFGTLWGGALGLISRRLRSLRETETITGA